MIIDRSSSMTAADLANAKNGATAVLQMFDDTKQHVGLGVLGAGNPGNLCNELAPTSGGRWQVVPLSNDYKNSDGTLNSASQLVNTINCLTHSSQGTNIGSPVRDQAFGRPDAYTELTSSGRPGVKKGIILLTDGAANQPTATTGDTGNRNCGAQSAVTSGAGDNNGFEAGASSACGDGSGNATDTNSGTNTNTPCTDSGKDRHIFRDYNISIPAGASVSGISVRLDAWTDSASGTRLMCGELSWDGGANWTAAKQTNNLSTSQASYTLGGSTDTWGRAWATSDTSNTNFRLRVTNVGSNSSRDFMLDWASVRVYYTTPAPGLGPCNYANTQANFAKAANIEIFTIGFGVESEDCVEPGTPYHNQPVTELLADMADNSLDDHGHCDNITEADAENADGDHFFCEPRSSDLSSVFTQAAVQLSGGTKLIPVFGY
jgi:hypothetical protein